MGDLIDRDESFFSKLLIAIVIVTVLSVGALAYSLPRLIFGVSCMVGGGTNIEKVEGEWHCIKERPGDEND